MLSSDIREEAKRLIDNLPPDSTWEDVMRAISARQAIDTGIADSREGRTTDVKEVRSRFRLDQ